MKKGPRCPSDLYYVQRFGLCKVAISRSLNFLVALAARLFELRKIRRLFVVANVIVAVFACHFYKKLK